MWPHGWALANDIQEEGAQSTSRNGFKEVQPCDNAAALGMEDKATKLEEPGSPTLYNHRGWLPLEFSMLEKNRVLPGILGAILHKLLGVPCHLPPKLILTNNYPSLSFLICKRGNSSTSTQLLWWLNKKIQVSQLAWGLEYRRCLLDIIEVQFSITWWFLSTKRMQTLETL